MTQAAAEDLRAPERAPRVTAVIVNWNKKGYLLSLLASLGRLDYPGVELILVDNASTDGSVQAVQERFPHVCIIAHPDNRGGTGGFNSGVCAALERGPDYVWLLDNDTEVSPTALTELVRVAEADRSIGFVGSKICLREERDRVQEVGAFFDWARGEIRPQGQGEPSANWTGPATDVDYCPACSLLVRSSVVREIGLMDECFFVLRDDLDWCFRCRAAGHRVVAAPSSVVWHESEVTAKAPSPTRLYFGVRNGLYLVHKQRRGWPRVRLLLRKFVVFGLAALNYRLAGQRALADAAGRAMADFAAGRMGALDQPLSDGSRPDVPRDPSERAAVPRGVRALLVTVWEPRDQVERAVSSTFADAGVRPDLLCLANQAHFYEPFAPGEIIPVSANRPLSVAAAVWRLFWGRYDLVAGIRGGVLFHLIKPLGRQWLVLDTAEAGRGSLLRFAATLAVFGLALVRIQLRALAGILKASVCAAAPRVPRAD